MKNLIILTVAMLMGLTLAAQKNVEVRESTNKTDRIILDFQFADNIDIKSWSKSEVYVKVSVNINDNEDNDKYRLEARRTGSGIEITENIDDMDEIGKERTVYDEENGTTTYNGRHIDMKLEYTVYVPSNITVKTETISGNIKASGLIGAMELKSISGDVDLYWGKNAGADLELKTISGKMFTDFDINTSKKGKFAYFPHNLSTRLNGGGNNVELNTISGNIYLRKK